MKPWIPAGLALAMSAPLAARADTSSDIAALRQEMAATRASSEQRLQILEQRLQAAETATQAAAGAAAAAVAAAPTPAGAAGGSNAFNPAVSLILSGTYARTSRDPANYAISGFALPAGSEAGPGSRGFSLAETELGLSANIDPWLRGQTSISFRPDNTVSVEEAFVQTTGLGKGLSLKAGRFFSGVGYLNEQHSHTWDFVDNPLAYQAFLGTQFGDDGVQLRWLAPTDLFIEAGAEVGRGRAAPGSDTGRNGAGAGALFAHAGGDIGDSSSWRAGLSMLSARATDQSLATTGLAGSSLSGAFSGRSRVWIGDFVWKWAPGGNATRTNFKLQGEYLRSTRDGSLVDAGSATAPYNATQSGWYLQGIYQFMPRWRAGVRTERLDPGATNALTATAYQPRKDSLMLDYNPSEFSRVRLQFSRDRSRLGLPDNQLFLQYQMSLGAHGAHGY
ncbi:MAG: hypothetical protein ABI907_00175 [Ramlibacter sp.]